MRIKYTILIPLVLSACAGIPNRSRSTDPVMRVAIDADSIPRGSYTRLLHSLMESGKFVVVDRSSGFKAIAKEQEIQHATSRFGTNEKYALWGQMYGVGGIFIGTQQCEVKYAMFTHDPYTKCYQNLDLLDATTGEVMAVAESTAEGTQYVAPSWEDAVDSLLAHYPKKFMDKHDLHRTINYDDALVEYREKTVPANSKPELGMKDTDYIK